MQTMRSSVRCGRRVISGVDLCRRLGAPVSKLDAFIKETIELDPDQIGDWIIADDEEDGGTIWLACIPAVYLWDDIVPTGVFETSFVRREFNSIFGLDKLPADKNGFISLSAAM